MRTTFATSLIAVIRGAHIESDSQLNAQTGDNTFNFFGDVYGVINGYKITDFGAASTTSKEFASFNLALTPNFEPTSSIRVTPAAAALSTIDADVLCLNEIYTQADIDEVISQLKAPSSPWASADIFVEYTQ